MSMIKLKPILVERRGELIAELFLQDLNPSHITKPTPDLGYDYFVGFPNKFGGVNNIAVLLKATEEPIQSRFPIQSKLYKRLTHSNIPALLLVVDVKQNQVFYAWLTPEIIKENRDTQTILVPVTEVNDFVKDELCKQLAGELTVRRGVAVR